MNSRYRFRLVVVIGLLAVGYGAVVAKLAYLQLLNGARLEAMAVRQHLYKLRDEGSEGHALGFHSIGREGH